MMRGLITLLVIKFCMVIVNLEALENEENSSDDTSDSMSYEDTSNERNVPQNAHKDKYLQKYLSGFQPNEVTEHWCPSTCDQEGKIYENPNLSSYCVCVKSGTELEIVRHKCSTNEIYNSTTNTCQKLEGNGFAVCVIRDKHCPHNETGVRAHPNGDFYKNYMVCLDDKVIIGQCNLMMHYDDSEKHCIQDDKKETILSHSECKDAPKIDCRKPQVTLVGEYLKRHGNFTNDLTECENCYYICSDRNANSFDLTIECFQEATIEDMSSTESTTWAYITEYANNTIYSTTSEISPFSTSTTPKIFTDNIFITPHSLATEHYFEVDYVSLLSTLYPYLTTNPYLNTEVTSITTHTMKPFTETDQLEKTKTELKKTTKTIGVPEELDHTKVQELTTQGIHTETTMTGINLTEETINEAKLSSIHLPSSEYSKTEESTMGGKALSESSFIATDTMTEGILTEEQAAINKPTDTNIDYIKVQRNTEEASSTTGILSIYSKAEEPTTVSVTDLPSQYSKVEITTEGRAPTEGSSAVIKKLTETTMTKEGTTVEKPTQIPLQRGEAIEKTTEKTESSSTYILSISSNTEELSIEELETSQSSKTDIYDLMKTTTKEMGRSKTTRPHQYSEVDDSTIGRLESIENGFAVTETSNSGGTGTGEFLIETTKKFEFPATTLSSQHSKIEESTIGEAAATERSSVSTTNVTEHVLNEEEIPISKAIMEIFSIPTSTPDYLTKKTSKEISPATTSGLSDNFMTRILTTEGTTPSEKGETEADRITKETVTKMTISTKASPSRYSEKENMTSLSKASTEVTNKMTESVFIEEVTKQDASQTTGISFTYSKRNEYITEETEASATAGAIIELTTSTGELPEEITESIGTLTTVMPSQYSKITEPTIRGAKFNESRSIVTDKTTKSIWSDTKTTVRGSIDIHPGRSTYILTEEDKTTEIIPGIATTYLSKEITNEIELYESGLDDTVESITETKEEKLSNPPIPSQDYKTEKSAIESRPYTESGSMATEETQEQVVTEGTYNIASSETYTEGLSKEITKEVGLSSTDLLSKYNKTKKSTTEGTAFTESTPVTKWKPESTLIGEETSVGDNTHIYPERATTHRREETATEIEPGIGMSSTSFKADQLTAEGIVSPETGGTGTASPFQYSKTITTKGTVITETKSTAKEKTTESISVKETGVRNITDILLESDTTHITEKVTKEIGPPRASTSSIYFQTDLATKEKPYSESGGIRVDQLTEEIIKEMGFSKATLLPTYSKEQLTTESFAFTKDESALTRDEVLRKTIRSGGLSTTSGETRSTESDFAATEKSTRIVLIEEQTSIGKITDILTGRDITNVTEEPIEEIESLVSTPSIHSQAEEFKTGGNISSETSEESIFGLTKETGKFLPTTLTYHYSKPEEPTIKETESTGSLIVNRVETENIFKEEEAIRTTEMHPENITHFMEEIIKEVTSPTVSNLHSEYPETKEPIIGETESTESGSIAPEIRAVTEKGTDLDQRVEISSESHVVNVTQDTRKKITFPVTTVIPSQHFEIKESTIGTPGLIEGSSMVTRVAGESLLTGKTIIGKTTDTPRTHLTEETIKEVTLSVISLPSTHSATERSTIGGTILGSEEIKQDITKEIKSTSTLRSRYPNTEETMIRETTTVESSSMAHGKRTETIIVPVTYFRVENFTTEGAPTDGITKKLTNEMEVPTTVTRKTAESTSIKEKATTGKTTGISQGIDAELLSIEPTKTDKSVTEGTDLRHEITKEMKTTVSLGYPSAEELTIVGTSSTESGSMDSERTTMNVEEMSADTAVKIRTESVTYNETYKVTNKPSSLTVTMPFKYSEVEKLITRGSTYTEIEGTNTSESKKESTIEPRLPTTALSSQYSKAEKATTEEIPFLEESTIITPIIAERVSTEEETTLGQTTEIIHLTEESTQEISSSKTGMTFTHIKTAGLTTEKAQLDNLTENITEKMELSTTIGLPRYSKAEQLTTRHMISIEGDIGGTSKRTEYYITGESTETVLGRGIEHLTKETIKEVIEAEESSIRGITLSESSRTDIISSQYSKIEEPAIQKTSTESSILATGKIIQTTMVEEGIKIDKAVERTSKSNIANTTVEIKEIGLSTTNVPLTFSNIEELITEKTSLPEYNKTVTGPITKEITDKLSMTTILPQYSKKEPPKRVSSTPEGDSAVTGKVTQKILTGEEITAHRTTEILPGTGRVSAPEQIITETTINGTTKEHTNEIILQTTDILSRYFKKEEPTTRSMGSKEITKEIVPPTSTMISAYSKGEESIVGVTRSSEVGEIEIDESKGLTFKDMERATTNVPSQYLKTKKSTIPVLHSSEGSSEGPLTEKVTLREITEKYPPGNIVHVTKETPTEVTLLLISVPSTYSKAEELTSGGTTLYGSSSTDTEIGSMATGQITETPAVEKVNINEIESNDTTYITQETTKEIAIPTYISYAHSKTEKVPTKEATSSNISEVGVDESKSATLTPSSYLKAKQSTIIVADLTKSGFDLTGQTTQSMLTETGITTGEITEILPRKSTEQVAGKRITEEIALPTTSMLYTYSNEQKLTTRGRASNETQEVEREKLTKEIGLSTTALLPKYSKAEETIISNMTDTEGGIEITSTITADKDKLTREMTKETGLSTIAALPQYPKTEETVTESRKFRTEEESIIAESTEIHPSTGTVFLTQETKKKIASSTTGIPFTYPRLEDLTTGGTELSKVIVETGTEITTETTDETGLTTMNLEFRFATPTVSDMPSTYSEKEELTTAGTAPSESGATGKDNVTIPMESRGTSMYQRTSTFIETKISSISSPFSASKVSTSTTAKPRCPVENEQGQHCTEEGQFRYNNSCTLYYECSYSESCGRIIASGIKECPKCLKFNNKQKHCDVAESVPECTYYRQTHPRYFARNRQSQDRTCTGPGKFVVPENKALYYDCNHKSKTNEYKLKVKRCPRSEEFNDVTKQCEKKTRCKSKSDCSRFHNVASECEKNRYAYDRYDCQKFYHCHRGVPTIPLFCPEKYVFNGKFCQSKRSLLINCGETKKMLV